MTDEFNVQLLLVESGGDNLAANFSRELADHHKNASIAATHTDGRATATRAGHFGDGRRTDGRGAARERRHQTSTRTGDSQASQQLARMDVRQRQEQITSGTDVVLTDGERQTPDSHKNG
ncbi:hypothetical protein DVH05_000284 [Phytophthora capsici]|nr:hypothetical protein DVH05_000281 [Phytophthora capsici]KAG1712541.1 hypothetical protein DVH05_000284 [Phytophthora capsici]